MKKRVENYLFENPALKNPIEIPTSALKLILFVNCRFWIDLYDISLLTDRQIFEYNLWLKITYSNVWNYI